MRSDRPFPFELITLVASFSTPGVVASLCAVSKDLNPVFTPALYRHVVITRANVDLLFLGLPRATAEKTHSEAETDVDDATDRCEAQLESQQCTWARRQRLFEHTKQITFAELPGRAFVKDLRRALKDMGSDSCADPLCVSTYHLERARMPEDPPYRRTGAFSCPTLFPNVVSLSFTSHCVKAVRKKKVDFLQSPLFAQPRQACLTLPRIVDEQAYSARNVEPPPAYTLCLALPTSFQAFTVHNLRYAGFIQVRVRGRNPWARRSSIPCVIGFGVRNRIFFSPEKEQPDFAGSLECLRGNQTGDEYGTGGERQMWEIIGPVPEDIAEEARHRVAHVTGALVDYGLGTLEKAEADLAQAREAVTTAENERAAARQRARVEYVDELEQLAPRMAAEIRRLPANDTFWRAKEEESRRAYEAFGGGDEQKEELKAKWEVVRKLACEARNDAEGMGSLMITSKFRLVRKSLPPRLHSIQAYMKQHTGFTNACSVWDQAFRTVEWFRDAVRLTRRIEHMKTMDNLYGKVEEDVTCRGLEDADPCAVCGGKTIGDESLAESVARRAS